MEYSYEINTEHYKFSLVKSGLDILILYVYLKKLDLYYCHEFLLDFNYDVSDSISKIINCVKSNSFKLYNSEYFKDNSESFIVLIFNFDNDVNKTLIFHKLENVQSIPIYSDIFQLIYYKDHAELILHNNLKKIIYTNFKYEINVDKCNKFEFNLNNIVNIIIPNITQELMIHCNDIDKLNLQYFKNKTIDTLYLNLLINNFDYNLENIIISLIDICKINRVILFYNIEDNYFEYIHLKNNINACYNIEKIQDYNNNLKY